jgi:alkylhydroperoxidase/carboxymuconolactone decarboxylase family protein YurZ
VEGGDFVVETPRETGSGSRIYLFYEPSGVTLAVIQSDWPFWCYLGGPVQPCLVPGELDDTEVNPMEDQIPAVSAAFRTFLSEAPGQAQAWGSMVQGLSAASALDARAAALAYLAVLAALRLESGIPFHVKVAKGAGATREEVVGAILIGLPAAGLGVIQALPAALAAYDA